MIKSTSGGTIITGKRDINLFMLMSLRHALALEVRGMKGRYSANLQACALLGLPKRNARTDTLKKLDLFIEEKKQHRAKDLNRQQSAQRELELNPKVNPYGF